MRKILVISPHFDDAVLSAGQLLAGRPNADVLTVFGGMPTEPVVEWRYDQQCGFNSPAEAVKARRAEDREALKLVGAHQFYLKVPDSQYQQRIDDKEIARGISHQMLAEDYEFIVGPLGIRHPDHERVHQIMRELHIGINAPMYFYEDLPARVLWPEEVPAKVRGMKLTFIGDGPREIKELALNAYQSQWGRDVLIEDYCFVPERFWLYE